MGLDMTPIKPFKILSTREEPDGTGVLFEISKSSVEGQKIQIDTIESYVLVPPLNDVDTYLFNYLLDTGWIV